MTTYVDHDTWTVLKREDSPSLPLAGTFTEIGETLYGITEVLVDSSGRAVVKCSPADAAGPES